MIALTKRRLVQLAGLSIANRIVPKWMWAQNTPRTSDAKRKVIIVTFGGGVRYAETFAPEGLRNVPRLVEMKPQGLFFRSCTNSGVLSHYNSTASILTGALVQTRGRRAMMTIGPGSLTNASSVVYQFLQLFAGLEVRNLFRRHLDAGSGLRIASNPRPSLAGAEDAKASELSFFASTQGLHDAV
jgi:hypothetical protein